ncbi:aldehyde dehydrogenase family protein [Variovorax sp. J22R133]|uniref:aldehyde dehydrogenase family protein n=1 Tax=Variovorax brevis TaxID=3053503 RepID=UPI0025768FE0|nr:aldehyde dehydrogenase family protein [Variovorax sp. J22R133]MDM0114761.1 aldehyde dehydrogenase family protein [Variovorax sp. J22R133]
MHKHTLPATPRRFQMFIDARWTDGCGGQFITRNSPGHGTPVARWPAGNAQDAQDAIRAARNAFDSGPWPRMRAADRAKVLFAVADLIETNADELGLIECLETGKPITQATGEIRAAADVWRFAAGASRTLAGETLNNLGDRLMALVLREPLGVIGVITPWNFPFFILAERLPFLLAAGCTAVVKPSEATSGTTLRLGELLQLAGLPDGVVNLVSGHGAAVGQAILDSDQVDMVSVTGSTATGRKAIQASVGTIKKLGLELGGKNPHIVFADANLDDAADGVAFAMSFNAGQCCVGASRLVVHRSVAEDFTQRVAAKLRRVVVGDPLDPATQVGALFDEAHMRKVLSYIDGGVALGATLVQGGGRTGSDNGFFVQPTLLTDVRPDMPLLREEIFGPVLAVLPFDTPEEAIRIANDTEFGLSASIWTQDVNLALRTMREVKAGRVWINTTLDNGPEAPMGGMKQSGLGRDAGLAGIEEYTEVKTAHINLQPRVHWIAS